MDRFIEWFCHDFEIEYKHGRSGEALEYHEFDGHANDGVRYIAQRSGKDWHVYRSQPGKKGQVRVLATFKRASDAIMYAAFACSIDLKGE